MYFILCTISVQWLQTYCYQITLFNIIYFRGNAATVAVPFTRIPEALEALTLPLLITWVNRIYFIYTPQSPSHSPAQGPEICII